MKNQQTLLLKLINSVKCYFLIFMLALISYPTIIRSITEKIELGSQISFSDSTDIQPDSLKQNFLRSYHSYRVKTHFGNYKINRFNDNYDDVFKLYNSKIADTEIFDFSKELYLKYYMKKIELHNFNDFAYLYMDLKQAQSNQGAIQLSIPLPNFFRVFNKKMKYKE